MNQCVTSDALDEFFRCRKQDDHWDFEVAVVVWDGPHTPGLVWKSLRRWKSPPNSQRLHGARTAAMKSPRFFRTCTRCGALTNAGQMHDRQTCQGCAEKFLGVVH